jgi:hypothetical protein
LTACKYAASINQAEKSEIKIKSTSMWDTIKESVLYHGLGNLSLFAISSFYGQVSFVHPPDTLGYVSMLACLFSVNGMAAWRVSKAYSRLGSREGTHQKSS